MNDSPHRRDSANTSNESEMIFSSMNWKDVFQLLTGVDLEFQQSERSKKVKQIPSKPPKPQFYQDTDSSIIIVESHPHGYLAQKASPYEPTFIVDQKRLDAMKLMDVLPSDFSTRVEHALSGLTLVIASLTLKSDEALAASDRVRHALAFVPEIISEYYQILTQTRETNITPSDEITKLKQALADLIAIITCVDSALLDDDQIAQVHTAMDLIPDYIPAREEEE